MPLNKETKPSQTKLREFLKKSKDIYIYIYIYIRIFSTNVNSALFGIVLSKIYFNLAKIFILRLVKIEAKPIASGLNRGLS